MLWDQQAGQAQGQGDRMGEEGSYSRDLVISAQQGQGVPSNPTAPCLTEEHPQPQGDLSLTIENS